MSKPTLIVLVGPTAVGKTSTAIQLANLFNTVIISADSRQFYKELSIGTAKPTEEEQSQAEHHFIDNLSITKEYNASKFEDEVIAFLSQYFRSNKVAVLCGGSGMYVNAVTNGFDQNVPTADEALRTELNQLNLVELQERLQKVDPLFFDRVDIHNPKRLMRAIEIAELTGESNLSIKKGKKKDRFFNVVKIGLELDRKKLYHRINQRVDNMMQEGLLEEVESVAKYKNLNALNTVGYKELFQYLEGNSSLEESVEKIKVNSRRYAKRQLTWFKRDLEIRWFSPLGIDEISMYLRVTLNKK